MNIGMYLTPDWIFPLFIVEVIMAENNDVSIKDVIAKILKSVLVTPVPENDIGTPAFTAAFDTPPNALPSFPTTSISTPDKANKNGAATTVAKVMNIT